MTGLVTRAWSEVWPISGQFVISRGARTEARVVVAEAEIDGVTGRGECTPYPRYGETIEGTLSAIEALDGRLYGPPKVARARLASILPPSAARNAVDCAIWDLEARLSGQPVHILAGLPAPRPVLTCYTLSLGTPEAMADAARRHADKPLLKLKLGGAGDAERMRAVREARPDARLVADANEAWQAADLEPLLAAAADAGLELIEQPLPQGADDALARIKRIVPVCADESAHTTDSLDALRGRYDAVNIKLDKTGGLTEAIRMHAEAHRLGFRIMVGCMLATSLSMAPAALIATEGDFADIDGPLLLARDRAPGISYANGQASLPATGLWGS
ncbi:MAG TPA: dipeptide epimerase [Hyphomicrobiaceae bacterium]|nr:dipeptide epimerase [Hyphomicrobiaceae bacterium]